MPQATAAGCHVPVNGTSTSVRPKCTYESAMIATHVDAGEDQGQAAEEAVQVEDPVRPGPAAERLGRQGQAPQHAEGQQRPGHDAAGAGRVPPQLIGHRATAASMPVGERPIAQEGADAGGGGDAAEAVDDDGLGAGVEHVEGARRAAQQHRLGQDLGRPRLAGQDGGERQVGGRRLAGAGIDEVVERPRRRRASGGAASSRWRRAPALRPSRTSGAALPRVLDAHRPRPPSGATPLTRRSPPTFTQAPSAPAATSSDTTMSAARPLPMPPGSKPVPAGRHTSSPSTTMSVQPVTQGAGAPAP